MHTTAECVYTKSWLPTNGLGDPAGSSVVKGARAQAGGKDNSSKKAADDAKLIFGTIFSLRNMVRKLGGDDDALISFRTGQYKLHYYETPTNLRFVLLTDTATMSMRNVMHQIYINLWVEYGTLTAPGGDILSLPPLDATGRAGHAKRARTD
jgi:trafficking protein particle complex subunit 1